MAHPAHARPDYRARHRPRAQPPAPLLTLQSAIIAGGGATRYGGRPKGLLEVGGRRIIDRVADALRRVTRTTPLLIANAPEAAAWLPGSPLHADVEPGMGSLGGILTAVEAAAPDPVLCVAWDMPFVDARLLEELATLLERGADAALPESDGRRGVEPLCAAYGPACASAIRMALARGDRRAIAFLDDVRAARLPLAAVLQYGDPGVLFFNVNSPDDLLRAESTWQARGSSPSSARRTPAKPPSWSCSRRSSSAAATA